MKDDYFKYNDGECSITATTCVLIGFSNDRVAYCNAVQTQNSDEEVTRVKPSTEVSEDFDPADFYAVCTTRISDEGVGEIAYINDMTEAQQCTVAIHFNLRSTSTNDLYVALAHGALQWRFDREQALKEVA